MAALRKGGDEQRHNRTGHRATNEHGGLQSEGYGQAGKDRVGDGVADKGHAAQHHVAADDAADDGRKHRNTYRAGEKVEVGVSQVAEEIEEGNFYHAETPMAESRGEPARTPKVCVHGAVW